MNAVESLEIPEAARNWKAPDERVLPRNPDVKREIEFSLDLSFRSADGNFEVLPSSDRILTNEDVRQGFESRGDKVNSSFAHLLEGLPLQLHDPQREMSADRRSQVESLRRRKPTFFGVDTEKVDKDFLHAAERFPEAHPGVILFPETGNVMNQFSAIQYPDGRMARLMQAARREDLGDFVGKMNLLAPATQGVELDETRAAFAMEFVQDGERPKTITQAESDDWLARVEESGLIFGFDASENDNSLDNFVRRDGKLLWVDGNVLQAKNAEGDEESREFLELQKKILSKFIDKGEQLGY